MAVITTYATLIENVQAEAEDDGTEFAAYLPTAINLAEERLLKECDFPELEAKFTDSLTKGYPYANKPSDYTHAHFLAITKPNGERKILKRKTDDFIVDYWPDATVEGEPKYYADYDSTTFLVAPTSEDNYSFTLKYTQAPDKLSTLNQSNYFITHCVRLLFYATLVEMTKFMKAWSQVAIREQDFVNARDAWNQEAAKQRRDDGTNPLNPEGGQNTLTHNIKSNSFA